MYIHDLFTYTYICNVMQCNDLQCNAILFYAIVSSAMQCHAMPCNAMQYNARHDCEVYSSQLPWLFLILLSLGSHAGVICIYIIYTHIYIYIYVNICIYIFIYTHTCAGSRSRATAHSLVYLPLAVKTNARVRSASGKQCLARRGWSLACKGASSNGTGRVS